ncbi:hypothetical protein D3C72_2228480 [compost metagenome]
MVKQIGYLIYLADTFGGKSFSETAVFSAALTGGCAIYVRDDFGNDVGRQYEPLTLAGLIYG